MNRLGSIFCRRRRITPPILLKQAVDGVHCVNAGLLPDVRRHLRHRNLCDDLCSEFGNCSSRMRRIGVKAANSVHEYSNYRLDREAVADHLGRRIVAHTSVPNFSGVLLNIEQPPLTARCEKPLRTRFIFEVHKDDFCCHGAIEPDATLAVITKAKENIAGAKQ